MVEALFQTSCFGHHSCQNVSFLQLRHRNVLLSFRRHILLAEIQPQQALEFNSFGWQRTGFCSRNRNITNSKAVVSCAYVFSAFADDDDAEDAVELFPDIVDIVDDDEEEEAGMLC